MPKSRGRNSRKNPGKGQRKYPRTDNRTATRSSSPAEQRAQLLVELPILQATDAAEARGDARGALELIEADLARRDDACFWRPERVRRLMQLSTLGPWLPRWATSRWILAQAVQTLDESNRASTTRAFESAYAMHGSDGRGRGYDVHNPGTGGDAVDRGAKVMDHDWVFRQALLYEFGGLQHFVARVASADLLAGADRIQDWIRAPMGGYRLLRETPRALTWRHLERDEEVETINIGAATLLEPGDCAIGRLVPIEGGAVFETAPLWVPDEVARAVADDPPGWIATLSAGCRATERTGEGITTTGHDFALLTDVPQVVQHVIALDAAEQAQGSPISLEEIADLRSCGKALVRAALDQSLSDSAQEISPWPSVTATLLDPTLLGSMEDELSPDDVPRLRRLAAELGGPAGLLCLAVAGDLEAAA